MFIKTAFFSLTLFYLILSGCFFSTSLSHLSAQQTQEYGSNPSSGASGFGAHWEKLMQGAYFRSRLTWGNSPGVRERFVTIGLSYYPCLCPCQFTLVGEANGHVLENGKWAANAGIGLRGMDSCGNYIGGANFFYDYRNGIDKCFQQIGAGLEFLTCSYAFRINGYWPVGRRVFCGPITVFDDYVGDFKVKSFTTEFSYQSYDAEIFRIMPIPYLCNFYLYAGGGPYYLRSERFGDGWGGKARAGIYWNPYLFAEVQVTHDPIFAVNTQGVIGIRVPFGWFCGECCPLWIAQPIWRRPLIPLSRCCIYKTNFGKHQQ